MITAMLIFYRRATGSRIRIASVFSDYQTMHEAEKTYTHLLPGFDHNYTFFREESSL